jgi:hypothetical protein
MYPDGSAANPHATTTSWRSPRDNGRKAWQRVRSVRVTFSLRDFIDAVGSAEAPHGAMSTHRLRTRSFAWLANHRFDTRHGVIVEGTAGLIWFVRWRRPPAVRSRVLKTTVLAAVAAAVWTHMPQSASPMNQTSATAAATAMRCWQGCRRLRCCPESAHSQGSSHPRNIGRCFVGGSEAARRRMVGRRAGQRASSRSCWAQFQGEGSDGVGR